MGMGMGLRHSMRSHVRLRMHGRMHASSLAPAYSLLRRVGREEPFTEGSCSVSGHRERALGLDRRETGLFYHTDELDTATVIEVSTRGTLRSRQPRER